jgi:hypothetical protein
MPTIIIIADEPKSAPEQAREASAEILRLVAAEIPPELSLVDRLKQIARVAVKLANAYQAIEAEARAFAEHVSSASHEEEEAPVSQGCATEADPNAN